MLSLLRLPLALPMLVYQSIMLALSQIWANKIRGILTTLGILIGVAAVSAVIALITGMKQKVLNEFEAFGTNKIFIEPRWPRSGRMISWRQIIFRVTDFENMIENCPSVAKFTHMHWDRDTVSYGTKVEENTVNIMGVDPDWHDIEHRWVTLGRPLTVLDNDMVRPICLINETLRDKLDMPRDPVGEYVEVDGNRMLVVGLLEQPTATLGTSPETRECVIPFSYAVRRDRYPWYSVLAASKSPQQSEDAQAEIEFYLRQKRGVKPGREDTFQVMTAQRVVDQFNKVATMVTLIATGIVGVSLLVGGVGIMNIMLVSVSERTREIGLRKAVGARPSAILLQFLVEAIVLCLVGGAMGLILGQAITTTVASFIPESSMRMGGESVTNGKGMKGMVVPPLAIAVAFGFSAATGLIFGMFPAIKAARLDPIEALRHE